MNKRRLAQRRDRNRALAIQDAANRCAFCRRALPIGYLIFMAASGENRRYCNLDCQRDHLEALGTVAIDSVGGWRR